MSKRRIPALALAFLGASCSQPNQELSIPFSATWDGAPVDCSSTSPALSDLRFYVSELQLIDSGGAATDAHFATGLQWQNDAVALIDLEDGTGACMNGTTETSSELVIVVPPGDYRGLRFTVGVPFGQNHQNPLAAEPPLDDPDMHWHWRSGYKFLRAGIRTGNDGFWIHTGSAGCEGTVGNISNCRLPHRVAVDLPDFVPGTNSINIDLAQLLSGTNLDDELASDCSSGPPESACVAPFAALGIDFESGQQDSTQRVFSMQ